MAQAQEMERAFKLAVLQREPKKMPVPRRQCATSGSRCVFVKLQFLIAREQPVDLTKEGRGKDSDEPAERAPTGDGAHGGGEETGKEEEKDKEKRKTPPSPPDPPGGGPEGDPKKKPRGA